MPRRLRLADSLRQPLLCVHLQNKRRLPGLLSSEHVSGACRGLCVPDRALQPASYHRERHPDAARQEVKPQASSCPVTERGKAERGRLPGEAILGHCIMGQDSAGSVPQRNSPIHPAGWQPKQGPTPRASVFHHTSRWLGTSPSLKHRNSPVERTHRHLPRPHILS